jgi:hypothetical protein
MKQHFPFLSFDWSAPKLQRRKENIHSSSNWLTTHMVLIMMMMSYVGELLHANDGDINGECMYAK